LNFLFLWLLTACSSQALLWYLSHFSFKINMEFQGSIIEFRSTKINLQIYYHAE
jgi:hypothetical protein